MRAVFCPQVVPEAAAVWFGRPPEGGRAAPAALTENAIESRAWDLLRPATENVEKMGAELKQKILEWEQGYRTKRRCLDTAAARCGPAPEELQQDVEWVQRLTEVLLLGSTCMQSHFESLYLSYNQARDTVLSAVRVVYATHDVGLKMLAKSYRESSQKALLADKPIAATFVDETQRAPLLSLLAYAGHSSLVVGLGDQLQQLPQGNQVDGKSTAASLLQYGGSATSSTEEVVDPDSSHLHLSQKSLSARD